MYSFEELRMGCILAEETNATIEVAKKLLKDLYLKANEPLKISHEHLTILEGRIKMLLLKQHIAKALKHEKLIFSNRPKIEGLIIEYHLEVGPSFFKILIKFQFHFIYLNNI